MAGRSGRWPTTPAPDTDPARRRWAAALFRTALPAVADFTSPRAWAFSLLGLERLLRAISVETPSPRICACELADRLLAMLAATGIRRLVLVRGRARLRQSAPVAGDDPNRSGNPETGLCRGRPAVAALADVAADGAIRLLQAGRNESFGDLRQAAQGIRPAAGRGAGGDFRLPRGSAGRRRRSSGQRGHGGPSPGSSAKTI